MKFKTCLKLYTGFWPGPAEVGAKRVNPNKTLFSSSNLCRKQKALVKGKSITVWGEFFFLYRSRRWHLSKRSGNSSITRVQRGCSMLRLLTANASCEVRVLRWEDSPWRTWTDSWQSKGRLRPFQSSTGNNRREDSEVKTHNELLSTNKMAMEWIHVTKGMSQYRAEGIWPDHLNHDF